MYALIAAAVCGIIMMFASFLTEGKKGAVTLGAVLMTVLLGINIWETLRIPEGETIELFNNMMHLDRYALMFNTLMTGCTLLYLLLTGRDFRKVGPHAADYTALIFFMLCGLYLLSSYNTLLMMFLGIEILSIPQYILAGSDKHSLKSSEASLKYFLMGSFSTGILLMGIALLFGATGTFYLDKLPFSDPGSLSPMALGGILLLIISFGFKVSAAPMHLWTPDVYDGSPTAFTAYMSTVGKAAAFIAFLRLFHGSFGALAPRWELVLAIITAATLVVGNLTAVFQQSVKRMLAYSSIAQAGFMLFAVISVRDGDLANKSMMIYTVAYTVATLGLFAVLMKLKDYTYDGFNGLAKKEPVLAAVTTIFILSLAGIPLTAGFMAKFYVLQGLMQEGNLMWLLILALVMAAVSVYYYFRVIMAMYFKSGDPELCAPIVMQDKAILVFTAALVILVGVLPGAIIWWAA